MKKKGKIRFLIVENNRPMRNGLETMLIELGFRNYASVIDAEAAWEKIEEEDIDAVLSSLNLPGMSGLDLLSRIRNSRNYFNLPFVMIAGEDQKTAILNMIEEEVDYYLIKPVTPRSLEVLLDRIVRTISSPSRYDLAIYAGKYYYINKDLEKARKSFNIAVQINSEAALPHLYLGNIYYQLEDLGEAEEAYNKALGTEQDYVSALTG
ncbi:MAG: response regulator, partial [Desulfurivibrionaceae bacterium]